MEAGVRAAGSPAPQMKHQYTGSYFESIFDCTQHQDAPKAPKRCQAPSSIRFAHANLLKSINLLMRGDCCRYTCPPVPLLGHRALLHCAAPRWELLFCQHSPDFGAPSPKPVLPKGTACPPRVPDPNRAALAAEAAPTSASAQSQSPSVLW